MGYALHSLSQGNITPADIKHAYRKACAIYHPDRNSAGLEMMKLVNKAYDIAKDYKHKQGVICLSSYCLLS
ncbi:MAG: J domain-containing protein [Burkholderiales bacterium]